MLVRSFRPRAVPVLLVAALAAAPAGCGGRSPPSYTVTISEGQAAIAEAMTDSGATAVSVALVDENGLVWARAVGDADQAAGAVATTATLFGVCSVSKMLSTTAVMLLVDQGRVDLDLPVTTYVPAFAMPLDDRYQQITVRMLLNHSSGLPGNDMRGIITAAPNPSYAAQLMDALQAQRLKHDPGAFSAYNNDGFSMIANLVEAVSGQAFPDYVQANILTPLGMTLSRYATQPIPDGTYARSYAGADLMTLNPVNGYATGGLYSTPEEMTHLAFMLANLGMYGGKRFLSEAAVAAMAVDQRIGTYNPVPDEQFRFGLGWDTIAQPGLAAVGVTAWQKTGDMGGFYAADMIVVPDEKLAVVVVGASNKFESGHAVRVAERILLRALVERGRLPAMPAELPTTDRPTVAVPAGDPVAYAGHYGSSAGLYRVSFDAADTLSVEEFQDSWAPLYAGFKLRDDGWYAADGSPLTALKLLTDNGHVFLASRAQHGAGHYATTTLFALRFDDGAGLSTDWQPRVAEQWLPVNEDVADLRKGDPRVVFQSFPDVSGIIRGTNLLRDLSPVSPTRLDGTFLAMPDASRGLVDAAIESTGGEDWLRQGSFRYRPRSTLPLLAVGTTALSTGSGLTTEWLVLPVSGTLTITGASSWLVYDSGFALVASGADTGAVTLSGTDPKYLAVLGAGGAIQAELAP